MFIMFIMVYIAAKYNHHRFQTALRGHPRLTGGTDLIVGKKHSCYNDTQSIPGYERH